MKAIYVLAGAMIGFLVISPLGQTAADQTEASAALYDAYVVSDIEAYLTGDEVQLAPIEAAGVVVEMEAGGRFVIDLIKRQGDLLAVHSGKLHPEEERLGLHMYPAGSNGLYLHVHEVSPVPVPEEE